jgi:CopG family nickel-responsive transcriptional regulator
MGRLTRTALAIDLDLLERFDSWMVAHGYANRSEAMRALVRQALVEQEWEDPSARVVAALSVIYEHQRRDLAQQLTHRQHADHHVILCSQHVHLDRHNCLEVVVMQGAVARLRRLADEILAARGVKAGGLTLLSRRL